MAIEPPKQPYIKNYSMLPKASEENKNYNLYINELRNQIESCREKKSLIQGRLHWNKQRVSIIYSTGGIFTFELNEAEGYTKNCTF